VRADPRVRGRIARDVFTFLHFPMVAGIVFFAVAAKKAVAHPDDPLSSAGRFALGAGIAMFLLGFLGGRFRLIRKVAVERVAAALGVGVLAALGGELDAKP
jgi:low temperature requirement protein LtrA